MSYNLYVKEQLQLTNTKVHRWVDWNPDSDVYQAFIDTRRVIIPRPVCDWSFLVCLHELGHVSTGYRMQSYLMEYNAEKWAIKRAYEAYGIVCKEYEEDAKQYVTNHVINNIICFGLKPSKIKPYVLDWLGESTSSLEQKAADL